MKLVCLLFFIASVKEGLAKHAGEVIQVAVITRHGMRTPHELYPTDPWKSSKYWPEGWMKLTTVGHAQMKALGQLLKQRYPHLAPDKYDMSNLVVRSTNTSRTINSAMSLLSGLYPNQSIPILVGTEGCTTVFNKHKCCPAYDAEMKRIASSPEMRADELTRKSLYEWLSLQLGKKISSISSSEKIYTNLHIEQARGLELPAWTSDILPEPITTLAGRSMASGAGSKLVQRLRFGVLYQNILQYATYADADGSSPKILLYSAHDVTLAGMMTVLGIYDGKPPGFAASLLMEVHWNKKMMEKQLKFFYKSSSEDDYQEMFVPSCSNPCKLVDLEQMLQPIIPNDINRECGKGDAMFMKSCDNYYIIMAASMFAFGLGAIFIVFLSKIIFTAPGGSGSHHRSGYVKIP